MHIMHAFQWNKKIYVCFEGENIHYERENCCTMHHNTTNSARTVSRLTCAGSTICAYSGSMEPPTVSTSGGCFHIPSIKSSSAGFVCSLLVSWKTTVAVGAQGPVLLWPATSIAVGVAQGLLYPVLVPPTASTTAGFAERVLCSSGFQRGRTGCSEGLLLYSVLVAPVARTEFDATEAFLVRTRLGFTEDFLDPVLVPYVARAFSEGFLDPVFVSSSATTAGGGQGPVLLSVRVTQGLISPVLVLINLSLDALSVLVVPVARAAVGFAVELRKYRNFTRYLDGSAAA